jgi:alpha-glucosidase (family GH31 glycosyl hydrolase)
MKTSQKQLNDDPYCSLNYMIGDDLLIPIFMFQDNNLITHRDIILPQDTKWFDVVRNVWVSGPALKYETLKKGDYNLPLNQYFFLDGSIFTFQS